jgi:hypothetical protein
LVLIYPSSGIIKGDHEKERIEMKSKLDETPKVIHCKDDAEFRDWLTRLSDDPENEEELDG